MSMVSAMHITSFAVCEQGSRDYNDDTFADADLMAGRALVVSDGAGGHRGGAIAARIVTDQVLLHLAKAPQWTENTLRDAVDAASTASVNVPSVHCGAFARCSSTWSVTTRAAMAPPRCPPAPSDTTSARPAIRSASANVSSL